MVTKEIKAAESFKSGMNCAQSVLTAFSDELLLNAGDAERVASAFGGGMGRLQEKCGAVTGAFIAIGLHCSNKFSDPKERKEKIHLLVQELNAKFNGIHGSTICRDLMGCDLNTEEGKRYAEENKLRENVCLPCVTTSVKLLNEMLGL